MPEPLTEADLKRMDAFLEATAAFSMGCDDDMRRAIATIRRVREVLQEQLDDESTRNQAGYICMKIGWEIKDGKIQ